MRCTALLAVLFVAFVGCGGGEDPADGGKTDNAGKATNQPSTDPKPGDGPTAPESGELASLSGTVTLTGTVPPPRTIVVTKDADQCGPAAGEVQDVVVSADGGLAGVIVEIQGVDEPANGWTWPEAGEDGNVITQKGCLFEPNLLVVPRGAEIEVRNDDMVTHNVNTGAWNVLQTAEEAPIVRPIGSRLPVKVSCNIHSWMETWVYPAASPLYAVTDADGRYRIDGIPAGRYRVNFWHPSLAAERERVEFAGGDETHDVVFESPVD